MLIYQKVIYDDVILIPVFDLNSMDQNVFFDGTILNPAWISSISEVSSSLWISESKSAAWWIHRKSNMGPINCHEVKIVIYIYIYTIIYNGTSRNVRHYHGFSPRLKIRMCPSFPMDFPWCFRPRHQCLTLLRQAFKNACGILPDVLQHDLSHE